MRDTGILELQNLIIMGDFNSILQVDEVWGSQAKLDRMADFYNNLFISNHIVDV